MNEYAQILLIVALISINAGIWTIAWCLLRRLCEKKEDKKDE